MGFSPFFSMPIDDGHVGETMHFIETKWYLMIFATNHDFPELKNL